MASIGDRMDRIVAERAAERSTARSREAQAQKDREQRDAQRDAERAERAAQRESDDDDRTNARAADRDARDDRRNVDPGSRANAGNDFVKFDISRGNPVVRDLGAGEDQVEIRGDASLSQIRVTFTSSEVGNGNPRDAGTLANQDGGLAVRIQAEDAAGNLTGPVSRFDDEGIEFTTRSPDVKFDVRDLVSGAQRGAMFDVVRLGTMAGDVIDESGAAEAYYINAGMGNDTVTGGNGNDFLVGGAGEDTLTGNSGDDSFIGGGGTDRIFGGDGVDTLIFNISTDGGDLVNLGGGSDRVTPTTPVGSQIRLTFTSAEVGNGVATDGGTLANQDGGLAVRLQLEDADGNLIGPVTRLDDEGINFIRAMGSGQTFDVRDLVTGTQRGDQFDVVRLGTSGADVIDDTGRAVRYYDNGGMGDDVLIGGTLADFLVGGAGNDRINGREDADSFIGGGGADVFEFTGTPGNDRILDFLSGTDKIDLTAFGITQANITSVQSGANTTVSVDSDRNGTADFQITLVNAPPPQMSDFLL